MVPVNFSKFPEFISIRRELRIPDNYPADFKLDRHATFEVDWEEPLKQGLDIKADDENFIWSDQGLFYNGRRVLLYIRDQQAQYYNNGYKYHITWCRTLQQMHDNHRYDKYVVSTNTDGIFRINLVAGNTIQSQIEEKLNVCKNCLTALNWKNYQNEEFKKKKRIYEEFSLEEFFDVFKGDNQQNFAIIPDETDISASPNLYPEEWKFISKQFKKLHHYQCSACKRKIDDPKRLHVHHINGVKNDCRSSNLRVLCADCHQEQHLEHKILGSSNYRS